MSGCVAVFDLGKTNIKVVVFDGTGKVARRARPRQRAAPARRALAATCSLDTEGAWAFLIGALKEHRRALPDRSDFDLRRTARRACWSSDKGARRCRRWTMSSTSMAPSTAEYEAVRPPFEETLSPNLPRGLNLGRQIFYLQRRFPGRIRRRARVPRLSAILVVALERASWRPRSLRSARTPIFGARRRAGLSSMVDRLGWRRLFPPMRNAWDTLGTLTPEVAAATGLSPDVRVVCGAHDSNASLVPHLVSRRDPFTVISTGTWVIIMAVGGKGRLDPKADMLANVDVRGEPVPTARFMGGREFAALAGEAPADARGGRRRRRWSPRARSLFRPSPTRAARSPGARAGSRATRPRPPKARAALATLYAALMTAHLLAASRSAGRPHRRGRLHPLAGLRRRSRRRSCQADTCSSPR